MRNYVFIIIADILLALQFVAQKKYQNMKGDGILSGLVFNALIGAVTAGIFLPICGFKPQITLFSTIMSFIMSVFMVSYMLISFYILKSGNMALYTLFLMTGGMMLPYIWGVAFLDEPFTLMRSAGLLLIIAAVVLSNTGAKRPPRLQLILCFAVFLLNGLVSITSKMHQVSTAFKPIDSNSFVFWSAIIKCVICIPIILFVKSKGRAEEYKADTKMLLPVVAAAAFGGISYLFQLIGAINVPATVLYPLITGGTIVLSSLAGMIAFREKPTAAQWGGIILCVIGSCLFL